MSKAWEKRNEDYLTDIARDDMGDAEYLDVLDDLLDRAQTMRDAKQEEIDREETDA